MRRVRALERGLGGQVFPPAVVQRGHGEVAGLGKLFGAVELRLAEVEQARGYVDLRFGRVVGCLILALVDGEQEIALLDDRAVLEMDLVEIAVDAGPDRYFIDRLEPPDELIVLDDLAHDRLGHGNDRQLLLRSRLAWQKHCGKEPRKGDGISKIPQRENLAGAASGAAIRKSTSHIMASQVGFSPMACRGDTPATLPISSRSREEA